jgi:hypothetical protein
VELGLLLAAFGFGFRHGIDWDHIAALSDLTIGAPSRRRGALLSACYAAGHAAVVFSLGIAVVVFAAHWPAWLDAIMERVVGVTLVALGAYVLVSTIRHPRDLRARSRWMLAIAGARTLARRFGLGFRREPGPDVIIEHEHVHVHAPASAAGGHAHRHRHVGTLPDDPFPNVGPATAAGIGVLHGVGAETPTQVLIFATAAGVASTAAGVGVLAVFVAGLLVSNTAVAALGASGGLSADRHPRIAITLSVVTALFSLAVGTVLLTHGAAGLPSILGG